MFNGDPMVAIFVILGFALLLPVTVKLSRNARLRRRLRKTHSRIISKSSRPSVKFSVKVPKQK